jgi:hypothetical protein
MSRTAFERIAIRYPGLVRGFSAANARLGGIRNPTLDQFRAMFIAGNEAFNRGDFAAAFAGVAADCEYCPVAYATEGLLVGREQICRFFEREIFGTFADWRTDPVGFLQAGGGVFVVLMRGTGTGAASGVPTTVDFAAVWELSKGVPVRVHEYPSREQALSAVGLDRSAAAGAGNA